MSFAENNYLSVVTVDRRHSTDSVKKYQRYRLFSSNLINEHKIAKDVVYEIN